MLGMRSIETVWVAWYFRDEVQETVLAPWYVRDEV